ncbi:MAG: hypothetical protein M1814_000951 [Vezdaea aestivalis]|nr:MAG: hypothetical protein M1814_000951 [Vezdaea aestivalis]
MAQRHPFAICRSFVQGVDHPNLDPIYWFTQLYNDYQRHPDLLCIGFTVSWSLAAKMNELSCDYGHWEHYIGSLSERLHQKDNASEKLKCIRQEIVRKLGLDHEKSPQFKVECWRMFRGGCIKLVDYTVDVDDKFLSSNDPFNNDEYKGKAETFFLSTGLRFPIGAVSTDRIKHIIEKEFYGRTISRVIARHPRNEAEYSITKVASKIYHKDETDSKVHRYFFGRDGHRHELPVLESTRAAIGRNTPGKTDYLCSKFDSGSFARFKPFDDVIEILDENHLVVDQCSCYKVSSSWLENIPHYRWRRSYPIEVWRKTLSEYVSRHCLARFILPQMHSLARKKVKACFERMIYGAIGEERPQLRSEISCDRMNLLEAKARDLMKTSGLRRKKTHQWTLSSFAAQDLTPAAAGRIITDLLKQTSECLTELECNSCDLRFSREAPAGFFLYPFLAMYEISSVLSAIVDAFREVFEDVADSTGWPYYEWDDSVKHSRTPYAGRSIPVRAGKKFPLHKESSPNGPDRLFDLDSDYLHRLCTVFKWIRGQLILMCRGFYEFTSCVQVFSQYGCSDNVERYLAEVLVQRLTMPLSFRNLPKFTANLLVYGSCSTFFQLTSTDTKRGRWSSMNFDVYKLIRDHVIGADYSEDESNLESVWFQTFQGERYE